MTDDALAAHCASFNTVFDRAIAEPSRCLADIQAKARMLLDDMEKDSELDGGYVTDPCWPSSCAR